MPEVVKRIGPMALTFAVGVNPDGTRYAWLEEIGWEDSDKTLAHWIARPTKNGWERQSTAEMRFLEDLDHKFSDEIASSDAARAAIEAERRDLAREDAERYADQ